MATQIATLLSSTLALLDQFQETLTPSRAAETQSQSQSQPESSSSSNDAKPLALLSASSAALRAQVTKLSLLAITTPFTPSAVSTVLRAVNDSVLPSLITAALLITPTEYTKAFHSEILVLSRTALAEFAALVGLVKGIAEKSETGEKSKKNDSKEAMSKAEKDTVTVAAGRVWEACDTVTAVATKGVVGFVVHRVEQWRDLIRDAVMEIEEWDPEEDEDDFFDDLMGDEKKKDDDDEASDKDDESDSDSDDDEDTAALLERKKSTLRFLKPVAQVYPAVINYRLKNAGETPLATKAGVAKLELLMLHLGQIPDQVDEAAGALYEDDADRAVDFLKKIRANATVAVTSLELPWGAAAGADKAEDKFTVWSRTWLKVLEEVGKSIEAE
ncbi:hypothetical protein N7481_000594 [Penicillium waksmanii]|uniref:uncharacterized protein n=1 Tax=Penicillium waksmanii TaxID=69791 RepID=UPI0025472C24|nr:uncharacterized protein N7481_000594 [Penicillium waksmanii]KAJ6000185.1 hypothetical protein N7481_000594 [Penicillium waksmanii]